jgi:hypothetical protein
MSKIIKSSLFMLETLRKILEALRKAAMSKIFHTPPTTTVLSAFRAFWRRLAGNKTSFPGSAVDLSRALCRGKGIANQERDAGNDGGIR